LGGILSALLQKKQQYRQNRVISFLIHGFSPVVIVVEAPQASLLPNRKPMTFFVRFCVKACPEAERIGNKNEQEEKRVKWLFKS